MLEPAGSHGVWGLDDYQMLAFLFGASQLCRSPEYLPESIHTEKAMNDSENYMYFGCIKFIKAVKKGKRERGRERGRGRGRGRKGGGIGGGKEGR